MATISLSFDFVFVLIFREEYCELESSDNPSPLVKFSSEGN
jgi:hypothetical protein